MCYLTSMIRSQILGLGSYVPDRVVTNDEITYLDAKHVRQDTVQTETNDAWIQQRTGIAERRYVPNDGSTSTSDLALQAANRAIADAGLEAKDIEIFDPVPAPLERKAGYERAQLLVRAASRAMLQPFLQEWKSQLAAKGARHVRWSLNVDPQEV